MKVCFETFGCRLNKAEALEMEADYIAKGWELTDRHDDADLFVVRGCSVTSRAQRDCEKLIEHLHERYPKTPLRVCGCLTPSPGSPHPAPGTPHQAQGTTHQALSTKHLAQGTKHQAQGTKHQAQDTTPTRTAKAYLKVQDGCSGTCTFCIVPHFRGASRSVPFDEVLDRAKRFVDAGYREIDVTGCNLALYASGGRRLPALVDALADVSPDCRIRLGSVEPGSCARETVAAMAAHENVCRFLHVPVQSGSNRILQAMRRPYLVRDVEQLVADAMKLLPDLGLGCDVMTGFPGESEGDFAATERMLRNLPFNLAHVFPYSKRPGTLAAAFMGEVPRPVRSSRAHRLAALVGERRLSYAHRFLGRIVEIVVESETETIGWTGEYLRCRSVVPVPRKSRAQIKVTHVGDDASLEGRVITSPCP